MKWLIHALIIILPFLAVPVVAGEHVCVVWDFSNRDQWSADPTTLAMAWVDPLERLSASIPSLSPKEKLWLQEELQGDGKRSIRAISSREYAIRAAKAHASAELDIVRSLTEQRGRAAQTRSWLRLGERPAVEHHPGFDIFTVDVTCCDSAPVAVGPPLLARYRRGADEIG